MAELPPGFTLIDDAPQQGGPLVVTVRPERKSAPAAPLPEGFTLIEDEKPGMGASALRGVAQGLTFGLADESYGLTQGIRGMISGEGFGPAYSRAVSEYRARDRAAKEANPVTSVVGEVAGGMVTGLGAAGAGATLVRRGMTLPQMVGRSAIEGAGYGALHGAGNAEGGAEDRALAAGKGALTGAVIGAGVPVVARGIGAATGRLVSPAPPAADRAAAISVLEREGVPLSAGQRSGSKALQYAENFLGDAPFAGGQATRFMGEQGEAFTNAAMRRIGESGRATPEALSGARDRISQSFADLAGRNTLQADARLGQEIRQSLREYDAVLPSEQRAIVGNLANDLVQRLTMNRGALPGAEYQTIRSRLSRMAQNSRVNDPEFSGAIRGLRDAVDGAMMRSISPDDAGAWQMARDQWGNLKVLERASSAGGENAAAGIVSPAQLRIAASQGAGNRAGYARGEGDFAELARAGNQLMTPLPNSGTGQRNMLSGIAGGGVAAGGTGAVDPVLAAAIALGPAAMGRTIWSGPIQTYLANGTIGPNTRRAIEYRVRQLMQGGAQTQSPRLASPSR